jgi:hypothetical protein
MCELRTSGWDFFTIFLASHNRNQKLLTADGRSAASRLGKSGLNLSLVAACRAAFICVYKIFSHRERIFTLVVRIDLQCELSGSSTTAKEPIWRAKAGERQKSPVGNS